MKSACRLPFRYWGRKPPSLVRKWIETYSKPGELVADLFGGSGSIVQTALSLGRRAIYIDINPYACMIAEALLSRCKIELLLEMATRLYHVPKIPIKLNGKCVEVATQDLFSVICRCGRPAEFAYVIFDRRYIIKQRKGIQGELAGYFKGNVRTILHTQLLKAIKPRYTFVLTQYIQRLKVKGILEEREEPISALFIRRCACGARRVNHVQWVVNGRLDPAYSFPRKRLEYQNGVPYYQRRDVHSVDEFFLDRTACFLAWLWHQINHLDIDSDVLNCLRVLFLNSTARASKMGRINGGPWSLNSYWIPRRFVIKNPRLVFLRQVIQYVNYKKSCNSSYVKGSLDDLLHGKADFTILCGDARKTLIPSASVDYIITDPPYTAEVQYLELSTFFTSWLNLELPFDAEIVINPRQGKGFQEYIAMLNATIDEAYRILKRGKYFTLILPSCSKKLIKVVKLKAQECKFHLVDQRNVQGLNFITFLK